VRLAAVVACAIAVTPSRAHAQPDPAAFDLEYHAPDGVGCPTESALRSAVADELGYDPFEILDEDGATRIVVTLAAARAGVHGRIEMRLASGKRLGARELSAPTCGELTPALALAMAVAIDPLRAALPPPQPRTPPATTPAAPVAPAQQDDAEVPQRPGPGSPARVGFADSVHLRIAFGIHGAIDSAPAPAVGFMGRVGFFARRWSAAVELRGDVPATAAVDGGHVTTAMLAVFVVPCVWHHSVAFCALGGAGGQYVSGGAGFIAPRESWVPFATVGARIELELAVTRVLAVTARVDVLAPVTRTELYVGTERPQRVYRTAAISNTFGLALTTR
jgi:hypothetical protein